MELKTKIEDKKIFARIGLAIFVCMIVVSVMQSIYFMAINVLNPLLLTRPWVTYLSIAISFYCGGFLVFYAMVKKLPEGEKKESKSLSIGKIISLFFITFAIAYILNYLTNIVMMGISLLKGSEVINPLVSTLEGSNWIWTLIFAGILSPIVEEALFRGVMLNKVRMYGDKIAIITTAVLFGLFHGNFSQFFYAVALGFVFAYVTLKTGTIKYSIILHIAINITGSLIIPSLVGDGSNIMLMGIAVGIIIVFSIIGIVLLVKNRKEIYLSKGEIELEGKSTFKTVWCNVGMILYTVICLLSMVTVLFM